MDELLHAASVRQWVLQRARIGVEIPGFGHPLYPNGDPRAECLFRLLSEIYPNEMKSIERMISSASSILKRRPTIDLALAILVKVLRLPTEAGFYLFALGRAVGWIAHAVEQRCSNQMIRPRARYIGVMPG
jgi:citrate synthase